MPQTATLRRPAREPWRTRAPGRAHARRAAAFLLLGVSMVFSAAGADAQLRFAPAVPYTAGPGARAVAIGDLNRDGRPDLVIVNNGTSTISVRLNQGNGSFGPATSFATGLNPAHVALADLDGDGNLDAVVANQGQNANTVSIFFGDGTGSFAPRMDRGAGSLPTFVAIGDLNHDGRPDIVVADNGVGLVTVLMNLGNRSFATGVGYGVGGYPVGAAIGQLDAGGNPDVVAGGGLPRVWLLPGDGTGGFGIGSELQFAANPSAIGITDVNRDGNQDLLITLYSLNEVAVVLGNGNGTFKAPVFRATGNSPVAIATGDLNGDGWPDALVANFAGSSVSVLLGDGAGGLTSLAPISTQPSPISLATGDLNGDGLPDFAVANNGNLVSVFLQTPSPPQVRAVPGSLAFGAGYVGFPVVQTVRIQNIGSLPLSVTQASVSSPSYSILDPTSFTLARGEFRDLRVQFAPNTPGDYPATLTVTSNDPAHPNLTVPLSGSAAYPPVTQVSPAALTFTAVAGASDSRMLTLTNGGLGPLTYSLAPVGTPPPWLSFIPASGDLASGGSVQVTVGANAAALFGGIYTAVLRVSTNDPLHPQIDVPITFTVVGTPRIAVSPDHLDFGPGYLGAAQSLTLDVSNPGTQTLNVSSMTSDSPDFVVSGPTSFAVAPMDSRLVSVTDRRQIEGNASGTLTIASNDATTPSVGVPLTGSAADAPHILVVPTALARVVVAVGDSVLQQITISNTSHGTALTVQPQIAPVPGLSATPPFGVSPASASIDPGGSLVFEVAFRGVNRPGQDLGSTLTVSSNDPANPTVTRALALHVRGVATLSAAPLPLDFATGFRGVPDTLLLTVSNIGNDTLRVAGATPSDPDFSVVDPTGFALLAGASRPLHVRFGRTGLGSVTAYLTISSNDPASPAIVPMLGTVNEPPVVHVSPPSITATVALGDSAIVPLSIMDAGLGPLDYSISVRHPVAPAPLQSASTAAPEAVYSTNDPDPTRARAAPAGPSPVPQRDSGPHVLAASRVLVIGDGGTESDVVPILTGAGYPVTVVSDDSAWDGGNPGLDDVGTVVLLDGIDYGDNMPVAGQQALLDFVRGGGGVVVTEWISYEVSQGRYASMKPLVPITRTTGLTGLLNYSVVVTHAVTEGVSPTFQVAAGVTKGTLNSGRAVVNLSTGEPAVVVKEEGLGRIVDFAVAGNYNGRHPFLSNDMRHLLLNSVVWTLGFRWISYAPSTGTIAAGAKGLVNVKMVTTGFLPGTEKVELLVDSNDPSTPRVVVPVELMIVTGPTPVLASVVSTEAEADRVAIRWFVAGADAPPATIYRDHAHQGWSALQAATVDGGGYVVCDDRDVSPGESYGYRLGVREGGSERMVGETWVQTPAAVLALHGVWPTPSARDLVVSFSLPDRRGGRIELYDVHGRRWMTLALDAYGPGRHEARLDPRGIAPPGIYWVRLTSGARTLTTRAVLLR
jgi:hypothetical protein